MDAMIRNLDEATYRRAKAVAAMHGRTIGQIVNEVLEAYVSGQLRFAKDRSLADLRPEPIPPGNERLSEDIDSIIYGI